MQIEDKIRPWSAAEKAVGQRVHRAVAPALRQVLTKAYKVVDSALTDIPDELMQTESRKFEHIATGDFSADYFALQMGLARDIAAKIDFASYLEGYGYYASELMVALSEAEGGGALPPEMIRQLTLAIFADVAVAMSHFFIAEAEEDGRAMEVLGTAMRALAGGDLTHRIGADAPAKIARARADFNQATEALRTVMAQISTASADVGMAVRQISGQVDSLSQRTEQQAGTLNQSSDALARISENVDQTRESGGTAAAAARDAREMVTESAARMGDTRDAMAGIAQSSRETRKIVATIDSIAMQTNLLALNAGVEAARAGAAGRGFAVVATEVRSLAQRAGEAANSIRTLMDESARQVDRGEKLVAETGTTLAASQEKVLEIDRLLEEIAGMTTAQAESVRAVNKAVGDSSSLTQQNAAMAEETAAETTILRDNIGRLNALIDQFQLDTPASGSGARDPAAWQMPPRMARTG
ncbi:methyl-accepting chemotaxis protein [Acidimangrovimonas sediminis]|uniref:methyl-accepting chemotaxis protein n=1 Tax=Acidimangrovimonas sediminis TaxID=2056283 RepID=UPI000C807A76|nr:methyl-accepting chemotaxis protein [Acidimangrovimonas sediminis]